MRIERIELRIVQLPLLRTFRTSSSTRTAITHVLVRVEVDGVTGWGESAAPVDPYYCPETTETCWHILKDFLSPLTLGKPWNDLEELTRLFDRVKGNAFARAGLEMACWDAVARSRNQSLAQALGGTRTTIDSGVSLGIENSLGELFAQIDRNLAAGYRRVKLKIGQDFEIDALRSVRSRYPDLPLQVDANSAFTLDDLPRLKPLDELDLLLIEQPLAHDDLIDHAKLQSRLKTPICLDESLHSRDDVRKALDLDACRVVNIKPGRVGGLLEATRIHDLCRSRDIPVWCGGMHEFGIGRAANVALASLPGFTLPGDISGSDRYFEEDLVEPPFRAVDGTLTVPSAPGIGVEPILERIERNTLRTWSSLA
jgi:O-succinylbenzoate synthase